MLNTRWDSTGPQTPPWDIRPRGEPADPEHPFWSLKLNRDLVLTAGEMEVLAIASCLQLYSFKFGLFLARSKMK